MAIKLDIVSLRDKLKKNIMDEVNKLDKKKLPNTVYIVSTIDDDASKVYMKNKLKAIEELGLEPRWLNLQCSDDIGHVKNVINHMVMDDKILGIIIQKPLSDNLKPYEEELDNLIPRNKDIDQISLRNDSDCVVNLLPCTVWGIMQIIDSMIASDELRNKNVLAIGRSKIVGKPLVDELIKRGTTVMSANSKTSSATLKQMFELADIVVSAVGKPKIWDKNCFHKYQLLIDVGINRDENGKRCGDFDVSGVKDEIYYTPVPKGVGVMTVLGVQNNILELLKIAKGVINNGNEVS